MKDVGAYKQLRALGLEETAVTDAGVGEIAGLTELVYLNLGGTNATTAAPVVPAAGSTGRGGFVTAGLIVSLLALARRTASRVGQTTAAAVYILALLYQFRLAFQKTGDSWLVMLPLDVIVVGLCWLGPLQNSKRAAVWGVLGGFCALVNPIAGFTWATLSALAGLRRRSWLAPSVALLAAALAMSPWIVRNYLVFGRLIPVKSNLFYGLYQSQCLQPDGLIQHVIFTHHPSAHNNQEAREYKALGERAFIDRKREQFFQPVRADPASFAERVAFRFFGTTLWYVQFHRPSEARQPWTLWQNRVVHPLPFLALLILAFTSVHRPLHSAQWIVIGVYFAYLMPYVAVSYYLHYGFALLGVKVLFVLWWLDRVVALGRSTGEGATSGDRREAEALHEP
jgi:hypothetical protein